MNFVLCDHSATLSADDLAAIRDALVVQLNRDMGPSWGGSYDCRVGANNGSDVSPGEVEIAIFQNSDVAGAAGYHATTPAGVPYARAFLEDASGITSGAFALSVIISHEALETAGDPGANRMALRADGVTAEAIELCDRVEDTTYEVGGVTVSNFLLPSAFDPGAAGPYDFLKVLAAQGDVTPGGYVILYTATYNDPGGGFRASAPRLETRDAKALARKKHPASRTYRRGVRL